MMRNQSKMVVSSQTLYYTFWETYFHFSIDNPYEGTDNLFYQKTKEVSELGSSIASEAYFKGN